MCSVHVHKLKIEFKKSLRIYKGTMKVCEQGGGGGGADSVMTVKKTERSHQEELPK